MCSLALASKNIGLMSKMLKFLGQASHELGMMLKGGGSPKITLLRVREGSWLIQISLDTDYQIAGSKDFHHAFQRAILRPVSSLADHD